MLKVGLTLLYLWELALHLELCLGFMLGRGARGRMAGGLFGAIMGGGLGLGVRNMMVKESPAANMLAKIQATGQLGVMDRVQLQSILKDIYNNPGM